MDNIYRLSELVDSSDLEETKGIFSWRSELYDSNDNAYFLLAKFAILNKIDFKKITDFFKRYFSFDVYDLDCAGHRSIKYFFSIYSNTHFRHSDFQQENCYPDNILGMKVNLEYAFNLNQRNNIIRYCPECLKEYKLPQHASFDYFKKCPIHQTEFLRFFYYPQDIPLAQRNIKCYETLIKSLCPHFPNTNINYASAKNRNLDVIDDIGRWSRTINNQCQQQIGEHVHLLKRIDTEPASNIAHAILFQTTSLPFSIQPLINQDKIVKRICSISFSNDPISSPATLDREFHCNALLLVYSSFCFLHRRNEALFVRKILVFINEIKFKLINKSKDFWYFNKVYGYWTSSDSRHLNCDKLIHDLLVEWLIELWFPPLYIERKKRGAWYFSDFYLMNHYLVQHNFCEPLVEHISRSEVNIAHLHFYSSKFQELSRPCLTTDQMCSLDILMGELASSYIHDARVWLEETESGQKPTQFPPPSRSLFALQKVGDEHKLFSAHID
jgi:hypothetical protein